MPTYDYRCTSCGHTLEANQKITDAALKSCPACQQETLRRGPGGGSGFHLQGAGWYRSEKAQAPESAPGETPSAKGSGGCCPCGKSSGCSS